jgi:low temperature requirement protein LtrA
MLIRYVVVLVEAIAVIAISSVWPILSYKQTNLVERSATLTMIIIGEGIVGLASSVSTIATGCTKVTSEDIGIIVAAFLLLVELMITLPPRDHLLISSSVLLMDTLF